MGGESKLMRQVLVGLMLAMLIPMFIHMFREPDTEVLEETTEEGKPVAPQMITGAGVLHLNQLDLYDTVLHPKHWGPKHRGSNGKNTIWAVFFYKPYCGACRRVWPVYDALASSLAIQKGSGRDPENLRFAALDCVKYRALCSRVDADHHPMIRIYRANPTAVRPQRMGDEEWQGMLMPYVILGWFKHLLATGRLCDPDVVEWPHDDILAEGMLAFKNKGDSKVDRMARPPSDPAGYLLDATASLHFGLLDHVFPKESGSLKGPRLKVMRNWLGALGDTFPNQTVRADVQALRTKLGRRKSWNAKAYENALEEWGVETNVTDDSWAWCEPEGAGVGGYPCGLWILFHTMLANSNPDNAVPTLQAIAAWVETFFGCAQCSKHFTEMFHAPPSQGGASGVTDHYTAVLWLWRAHNRVRARLSRDDDTIDPKLQFPYPWNCEQCYSEDAQAQWKSDVKAAGGEQPDSAVGVDYDEAQFDEGNIFVYLQEVFCHGSDALTCAGFYDPSETFDSFSSMSMVVVMLLVLLVLAVIVCLFLIFGDEEEGGFEMGGDHED